MRRRAGRMMRTPAFGVVVIAPWSSSVPSGQRHRPQTRDQRRRIHPSPPSRAPATGRSGCRRRRQADQATAHRGRQRVAAPTAHRDGPGRQHAHPDDGAQRLPQRRTHDGLGTPGCGVSWNLLAGIGRIESLHANGGATDRGGTPVQPIYGPTLDGTLAGNKVIVQSVQAGRVTYARAMGPMRLLPGTWARGTRLDGDGDGKADVQNLFDSTLAAARYLCSGNLDLRDQSHVLSCDPALQQLDGVRPQRARLGGGVRDRRRAGRPSSDHRASPADLRPAPRCQAEGLGPGLPLSATGLPASVSLAITPLFDIGTVNTAGQMGAPARCRTATRPVNQCERTELPGVLHPEPDTGRCRALCRACPPPPRHRCRPRHRSRPPRHSRHCSRRLRHRLHLVVAGTRGTLRAGSGGVPGSGRTRASTDRCGSVFAAA